MAATYNFFGIPLVPEPQKLAISLGGVNYVLKLRYNARLELWLLDIADAEERPLVSGIPLVTGADLLGQYRHLGIKGALIAYEGGSDRPPMFDTLGVTGGLVFAVEATP